MSNTKLNTILFSSFLLLSACNVSLLPSKQTTGLFNDAIQTIGSASNQPVTIPDSVIVCRSKQCAPANLSMSAEYIYNSLIQLFYTNNHQTALICKGNSSTRSCIENFISMPITVGITPANAYIDSLKISDVSINKGENSLNLLLNYNLTYNGQTPECSPAKSLAFVQNAKNILLEDSGYNCKMTTISSTDIKTFFAIDYIDLDYGFIGGFYSIGLSGPAYGGGNGYMIIRLPKDAHPLNPELKAHQKAKANKKRFEVQPETTTDTATDDTEIYENVQVFPIKKQ